MIFGTQKFTNHSIVQLYSEMYSNYILELKLTPSGSSYRINLFQQTIVSRGCLSSSFTADESITHSRHWVDSHHQCVQVRTCRHHPLLLGGRLSFGGKVTLSLGKKIGFPHFFSTFFILVIFLLSYLLLLCCLWNKYLCFWVPQKLYVNGRIKKHFLERKFEVKPPTKAFLRNLRECQWWVRSQGGGKLDLIQVIHTNLFFFLITPRQFCSL